MLNSAVCNLKKKKTNLIKYSIYLSEAKVVKVPGMGDSITDGVVFKITKSKNFSKDLISLFEGSLYYLFNRIFRGWRLCES